MPKEDRLPESGTLARTYKKRAHKEIWLSAKRMQFLEKLVNYPEDLRGFVEDAPQSFARELVKLGRSGPQGQRVLGRMMAETQAATDLSRRGMAKLVMDALELLMDDRTLARVLTQTHATAQTLARHGEGTRLKALVGKLENRLQDAVMAVPGTREALEKTAAPAAPAQEKPMESWVRNLLMEDIRSGIREETVALWAKTLKLDEPARPSAEASSNRVPQSAAAFTRS